MLMFLYIFCSIVRAFAKGVSAQELMLFRGPQVQSSNDLLLNLLTFYVVFFSLQCY